MEAYIDELYRKDLHDPDKNNGVITHLEPDILQCKVKWILGSITTNKASGGDGITVVLCTYISLNIHIDDPSNHMIS